jgi:hypothetical protein
MKNQVVCLDGETVAHLYHKIHDGVLALQSKLKNRVPLISNADVVTKFFEQDGKLYIELTYWKDDL